MSLNGREVNSVMSEVRNTLAKHNLYFDPYSILELITILENTPCNVNEDASLSEFLNSKLSRLSSEALPKEVSVEFTEIKRRICYQKQGHTIE